MAVGPVLGTKGTREEKDLCWLSGKDKAVLERFVGPASQTSPHSSRLWFAVVVGSH